MVSLYKRRTNDEKRNHNHWREWKSTYPDNSRLDVGLWNSRFVRRILRQVNSHIKSIFKDGLLREDEVMQTLLFRDRAVDLYNLEMITMLSFRFASPQAKSFRQWIIGRLTEKKRTSPPLLVCYGKGGWYNWVWEQAVRNSCLTACFSVKASQTEGDNSPVTVFLHLLPGRVPFRLT